MRAVRELAKKADQQRKANQQTPSNEEKSGSPSKDEIDSTPKTKDKKRSADEIRGQRGPGKKGETREQQRRRVKRRWQRGFYLAIAEHRKWQLDDLKKFRYATKLPPKNTKARAKFGSAKKIQELEDKLELVALREQQLEFVKTENLRLQFRIGIALTNAGNYLEAFDYLERVCKMEGAYQESEEDKKNRLKIEFDICKERGKLQLQLEFEAEQAMASKAKKKADTGGGTKDSANKGNPPPAASGAREVKAESKNSEDGENEAINPDYSSHMWAARCCVGLFKTTKMHYHLNAAYGHYLQSIECMTVPNERYDMSTNLRLPVIYFELGELFELFGSMESALSIYSRSMNEFPNSRNYFDIMYRSCLVGRHLMEITTNEKGKQDMLNRCIDMLQFLLEALPEHINEANTIFLYARTLDQSDDPAVRYRSIAAYDSLFLCMNSHKIANAENFGSFNRWAEEPDNWLKFAAYIKDFGEEFLSKDAYETYMSKMNSRRKPGKPLEHDIETDVLLEVAATYANHQNYKDATKYAEMALNKDRLNKKVRQVLSSYSKVHKEKLDREVISINTLHRRWSERAWTDKSRKKLKEMEMERLVAKYQRNIFDREARRMLAYYDREAWRSKFIFEISCVVRVQRFIRNKFVCWKVQQKFRERYLGRASRAYTIYNREPYSEENRKEIRAVCASRFCPRKHIIRKVRVALDTQDDAALVITRNSRSYLTRIRVYQGIARTKARREDYRQQGAWKIQQMIRMFLARKKVSRVTREWARKAVGAVVVQRFWRWREKTFQHAVTKVVAMMRRSRARAFMTFQVILKYHLMRKLRARRGEMEEKSAARLAIEEKMRRERLWRARNQGASVIQRFFASCRDNFLSRTCSQAVRVRRRAGFSHAVHNTVARAEAGELGYVKPGFRQSGHQFGMALAQREVFCSGCFDSADGLMLATLLKHSACEIRSLIFHDIADGALMGMEEHILPALKKCASIRRVAILGGSNFPESVFQSLLRLVQVDNPRIVHLHIELVNHNDADRSPMKRLVSNIVHLNANLLMDYFNYCLPGLRTLSLQGCYMRDEDASLLMDGLRVNSSLRRLSLGLNILTDITLIDLLHNITADIDRASSLEHIEMGYNLICCGSDATMLMERLTRTWLPKEEGRKLYLHLEGNPIPLSKERRICSLAEDVAPDAKRGLRIGATSRINDPMATYEIGDEASVVTKSSQSQAI